MKKGIFVGILLSALILGMVILIIVGYAPGRTIPNCSTSNGTLIKRDLYELCYNAKTKQPYWILQFLKGTNPEVIHAQGLSAYVVDPEISPDDQASIQDYESSDWVLGNYLFPSTGEGNESQGKEGQYLFSVTSPQDPSFQSGYWKKLRNYAHDRAKKSSLPPRIAVLSGPLFLTENSSNNLGFLEPGHIPVPTHFFQVIVPSINVDEIETYIVPNKEIDEDIPLDRFRYSLRDFQKKTGIKNVTRIAKRLFIPIPTP